MQSKPVLTVRLDADPTHRSVPLNRIPQCQFRPTLLSVHCHTHTLTLSHERCVVTMILGIQLNIQITSWHPGCPQTPSLSPARPRLRPPDTSCIRHVIRDHRHLRLGKQMYNTTSRGTFTSRHHLHRDLHIAAMHDLPSPPLPSPHTGHPHLWDQPRHCRQPLSLLRQL